MRIYERSLLAATILSTAMSMAQSPAPASSPDAATQAPAPLPQAPMPQPPSKPTYHPNSSDSYLARMGFLCGAGASGSPAALKPTVGCGAGFTLVPYPIFFEVGVMGPQANRSYLSSYISLDSSIPLASPKIKYLPMAIVGYSRLFETGHALDYGVALGLPRLGNPKDPSKSLRIELRDYCTFANPTQHDIMLRIGWMSPEDGD
jgi:hypothetical protein